MDRELLTASAIEEAVSLKDDDSAFFAGGTEIERLHSSVRARKLISVTRIPEMKGITRDGAEVRIGALTTFTRALEDPKVPDWLREALRFCGSLQKRNMATVGGNVAAWRCDSYLIPTLIAGGARIELADRDGCRTYPIAEYAQSRELLRDALILSVIVRADLAPGSVLSRRYANTVESHAYLTIAMGREGDDYRIGLAIKGGGIFCPDILSWSIAWKKADVKDDIFGSEAYKRYLTGVTLDEMYEKLSGEGGDQA